MKKEIVFVVGMSRAGTTFLYHNLQKHPDIFVPAKKEIGYFAHHYEEGEQWYLKFFDDVQDGQVPFDICGVYFTDDNALARIKSFNPDTKVIIGVRDPFLPLTKSKTYFARIL